MQISKFELLDARFKRILAQLEARREQRRKELLKKSA